MPSIPASAIVTVTPSVISAGGNALDLAGLCLMGTSARVPINSVYSFPTAAAVGAFFGIGSQSFTLATTYFNGFLNSNKKPGAMLFAQYPFQGPVGGWLRGGNVASIPFSQIQALSGTISLMVANAVTTSATITLSGATSFSAAAALIQAAFTTGTVIVTYDPVSGGFLITSVATGVGANVTLSSATSLATSLNLVSQNGAAASLGAAQASPVSFMQSLVKVTQNWATFFTDFEPSLADKLLFAQWTSGSNSRYLYAMWDTNLVPQAAGDTTSAGALIVAYNFSGTAPIIADINVAVFLAGAIASIDFTQRNGRATLAFKSQAGLVPAVVDAGVASNLIADGYNFYGAYATANQQFQFFYPGNISGQYKWIDSYVNQIWMNNQFQLAMMVLLTQARSIPYNLAGYTLIEAALLDPINQSVAFGAIRRGVTLSQLQIAEVNAAAGVLVDTVLSERGWYLQIADALPQVRAVRQSPPCTFWYMDGGSVQQINLASVEVQ